MEIEIFMIVSSILRVYMLGLIIQCYRVLRKFPEVSESLKEKIKEFEASTKS